MKMILSLAALFVVGCVPVKKSDNNTDPQAVKRITKDDELTIIAQKPDDMRIVDMGNTIVSFRTAKGVKGKISLVNNGDFYFISVRESLSDEHSFWREGKSMRDVFLIPKINGRPDRTITKAKSEKWQIEKIVSSLYSYARIKELNIYCPTRIEFRKKDGSKHVSEFPERTSCESDINTFIGDLIYN